mgnify:CR=1 FL=1
MTERVRSPWMTATAAPRRTLAEALPRTAAPATASWLPRAPEVVEIIPPPPACTRCADLAELRHQLGTIKDAAVAAGRLEGMAESTTLRARLAAAAAALEQAYATRTVSTIDAIVEVALGVCAELAPAAAALDRTGVAALIAQVIAAAGPQSVALRAHPDDVAALAADLPEAVRLEADPALAPGEVRATGARLVIDATWATRLAALREPLRALLAADVEDRA